MNYNADFDEDLMSMGNIHATHAKPLAETYSMKGKNVIVTGGSGLSFQKMPIALTLDIPEDYTPPRKLAKKSDGTVAYDDWYEE